MAQLQARNIEVTVFDNVQAGMTQFLFKDPHGITLELDFTAE